MPDHTQNYMPQIQALRGFAAICVVLTHAFLGAGWVRLDAGPTKHPHIGEFGVDVFFVISGFIMVVISHNDFGKAGAQWAFLSKRLKRIFPLYWLLTITLIIVVIVAPQFIAYPKIDVVYWLKSLLLIPAEHPVDDGIRPLLVVGWTLQYEMFFYVLFAISMFFSKRVGLSLLFAVLFIFSVAHLFSEPQNILLSFYSEWIILEFAGGMGLAILYVKGRRLPAYYRWVLPSFAIAYLVVSWHVSANLQLDRIIYFGIPATLLMAGLTLPEGVSRISINRIWRALGDSSYALYLSHVFVIAAMGVLFTRLGSPNWQQHWSLSAVFIVVALVLSCIVGWALHRLVDRPIAKMLATKTVGAGSSKQLRNGLSKPVDQIHMNAR